MRGIPYNVNKDIEKNNYKTEEEEQKAEIFLRGDLAKFVIQVYNTSMRLDKKCNSLALPWRLEIVRSFLNQTNEKDCGVLVAFFFECVSRRINFYNIPKGVNTDQYREWMAFCNYVNHRKYTNNTNKTGEWDNESKPNLGL